VDKGKDLEKNEKSRKLGIKIILRLPLFIILQAAILFVSAGRIDMPRAWIYVVAIIIYYPTFLLLVYKHNPELIYQRACGTRRGTKPWDRVLMPTVVIIPYIQLAVIGLDVGRFQLSSLSTHFTVLGLMLLVIAATLIIWAMVTNPYFEPTVRIQEDRGHLVITTGPYKIMRHPGYLSGILWPISTSFITGSVFGLIPAGIVILLFIIRTWLEDKMLMSELNGYAEYARRVKYRLFPGLW